MFSGYDFALFLWSGYERASGQVIGAAEQSSWALVDGENGLIGKELVFNSGDFLMMFEVVSHFRMVKAFQMTSGYHPGGYGAGGVIHEFIEQVILAWEDDGEYGFGVVIELA
jgi:uncharacterized protein YjlB